MKFDIDDWVGLSLIKQAIKPEFEEDKTLGMRALGLTLGGCLAVVEPFMKLCDKLGIKYN